MGMTLNENNSVADQYKKCYPKEKAQIQRIKLEESVYRTSTVYRKQVGTRIAPEEFSNLEYFFKRWGSALLYDYEQLMQFLKVPRQFGSIFIRRRYPPYLPKFHQTMRNTSIANQVYEFGHTYVGIGFVDLFQLAWGSYKLVRSKSYFLWLRLKSCDNIKK